MHPIVSLRELAVKEDGGFLGTALLLGVVIIILAIVIIDGTSVFSAYEATTEATQEAADRAAMEYKLYRNETMAEQAAAEYCEEKGLEFIEIIRVPELGSNAYTVTCEKDAKTYVFKHLPYLNDLVHQHNSSTSYRSI